MLAHIEIHHSRAFAPTRRVALGDFQLPVSPPPGFGGILLGGIVAANIAGVDEDFHPDLTRLTMELEEGKRIPQPRLRNRLQVDRVGLQASRFELHGGGERLEFDFTQKCTAAQAVLGALYAAGGIDPVDRHAVMATIRRAMRWGGPVGPEPIASLAGTGSGPFSMEAFENPVAWAMNMLGFASADGISVGWTAPPRKEVLARFRAQLSEAHPDHGGAEEVAAQRIADLTEARRILLAR